jgi:prepilin-type N-terminal cleavage/methylation domain-containing protein
MDRKQKGFTLIEILVVVTIIGVLAGLVVVLIPKGTEKANQVDCTNNVKNLCHSLLALDGQKFPAQGGVNLMLYLFKAGEIEKEEQNLRLLFCPGDLSDSWELSGGVDAYTKADLSKQGEYGNLSSYAGRNQLDRKCAANRASSSAQALICDDSQDHHLNKGFVVGYSNASVKFREKFKDWKKDVELEVKVGEGSEIVELQCLNTDD